MKPMDMQIERTRRLCVPSLLVGTALAGIAGTAMLIDLSNNYSFGAAITEELGLVMALAAIALTALPAAAALLGRWDALLRTGTVFAVLLTVLAAVSAYSEKQGQQILQRQGSQAAYEAAQRDAEAARKAIALAQAEAAAISEASTVTDLEKLEAYHREQIRIETEDRGGCGGNCRKHEGDLEQVLARLPKARAKEAALARVDDARSRLEAAKVEAKAGPAEASMLATVIAGQIGGNPADVARTIALGTTGFSIAVTLIMAMLAHQATALLMKGLGMDGMARQDGVGSAAAVASLKAVSTTPQLKEASGALKTALSPLRVEDKIRRFKTECMVEGGEATGGDVQEAFAEWWREHFTGETQPSPVIVARELQAAGVDKFKRGGRVRYAAGLNMAAPVS